MRIRSTLMVAPFFALALAACGGEDAPAPPQAADQTATPAATDPATTPPAATPGATPGATSGATSGAADIDLPEGVTAEMVAQGGQIFHGAGICFTCHGQQGAGGPLGPQLSDDEWLNISAGSYEEIVNLIQTGVPQPVEFPAPMPPNGGASLSDEQRAQVAAYVYSLSHGG